MRKTIYVTSEQFDTIKDYITLNSIEARFTLKYDDFNADSVSDILQDACIECNSYLKSILSDEQYRAIKDAEIVCDDYESLTLIDFDTFLKYIDIVVE